MPKMAKTKVTTRTVARFRSDHATTAESSATLFLLVQHAAKNRAFQRERACHHHLLALAKSGDDLDFSDRALPENDVVHLEVPVRLIHENYGFARYLHEGCARHDEARLCRLG